MDDGASAYHPEPFLTGDGPPDPPDAARLGAGTRDYYALRTAGRHPSTVAMGNYFAWGHLPGHLQLISSPYGLLFETLLARLPDGPEFTVALRKLVESKDCAVRARVDGLAAGGHTAA